MAHAAAPKPLAALFGDEGEGEDSEGAALFRSKLSSEPSAEMAGASSTSAHALMLAARDDVSVFELADRCIWAVAASAVGEEPSESERARVDRSEECETESFDSAERVYRPQRRLERTAVRQRSERDAAG
jgi:hypothetical protein